MTLLFTMNIFLAMTFMFMKHPISMGAILLAQTIIISLTLGNMFINFWFSYILFLIMVGGMMVLFLYMTSIASNEPFHKNIPFWWLFTPLMLYIWATQLEFLMKMKLNNEQFLMMMNKNEFLMFMNKFMNNPSIPVLMFIIMYLFLTLIVIVKITNLSYGPLRQ